MLNPFANASLRHAKKREAFFVAKRSDLMVPASARRRPAAPRPRADQTDAPPVDDLEPAIVPDLTADAIAVGPRARALLRGREIAAEDLKRSGGSYSLDEVRRLLNGVSRQSVEKRVREGRLLAVSGPNNKRYYPVAQFNDDGSVVEGLREVQRALATENGNAVLNFLVNATPQLDDRRPLDLLKRGEVDRVIEAAERTGEPGA
jgi:hypothetical protein